MKKIFIGIITVVIILIGSFSLSYINAKEKANLVAKTFTGNLSPFTTQLFILGGNTNLPPCWIFRAEYYDLITGATFDVYVSIFGKVLKVPPKSKAP